MPLAQRHVPNLKGRDAAKIRDLDLGRHQFENIGNDPESHVALGAGGAHEFDELGKGGTRSGQDDLVDLMLLDQGGKVLRFAENLPVILHEGFTELAGLYRADPAPFFQPFPRSRDETDKAMAEMRRLLESDGHHLPERVAAHDQRVENPPALGLQPSLEGA
ncbi:hypothetical protein D3C72_1826380 [compost metagenome]